MQLRTTKTTFSTQKIQNKHTIVYFKYSAYHLGPVCLPPMVRVPQAGNPCGLCYKCIVHRHLSVKLHFCVKNLKFTSKCPFLRTFVHFYGHLTVKVHIKAYFFFINYGHLTWPKKLREKLQTFDREPFNNTGHQLVLRVATPRFQ